MNKFKLFLAAFGLICSAIGSKVLAMNDVTSKTPENNLNLNFDNLTTVFKKLTTKNNELNLLVALKESQLSKEKKKYESLLENFQTRLALMTETNKELNEIIKPLLEKKLKNLKLKLKNQELSESNATITEKNRTLEAKTNQLKMAIGLTAGGATSSFLYIKTSLDNTRSSLVGAGVTGALNGLVLNKDRENGPKKALKSAAISFVINYAINYFLLTEIKEAVAAQKLAAETITKQA